MEVRWGRESTFSFLIMQPLERPMQQRYQPHSCCCPIQRAAGESGPGCTPPRLYKNSLIHPPCAARYKQSNAPVTATIFCADWKQRRKSFCGLFFFSSISGVFISGQSEVESTGRFLLRVIFDVIILWGTGAQLQLFVSFAACLSTLLFLFGSAGIQLFSVHMFRFFN